MPDRALEFAAGGVACGVDEAGRGPLAGPVVAAAVILPEQLPPALDGLDDSKKLSAERRAVLFAALRSCARIGVGRASVAEIDRLNILGATMLAMARAVEALGAPVDVALIDGNRAPKLACRVRCVIGGDGLSLSIAAASIVAKETRDAEMRELARDFPGYGWNRNAGYPTPEHRAALMTLGPTPHHRASFAPVSEAIAAIAARAAAS